MAQAAPAPKATSDATVNIDANGKVTVNPDPLIVSNGGSSTITFTYEGTAAECELKIKFHGWKATRLPNGGTVSVGS